MTWTNSHRPISARQARDAASLWIETVGSRQPGYAGAWLSGSVCWLDDAAVLSPWTDVDVMLILDHDPPRKLGKMVFQGVLLEITYVPRQAVASPDAVLGNYRMAAGFASTTFVADPAGLLKPVQRAVARAFPHRAQVLRRMREAEAALTEGLTRALSGPTLADRAMWVFPAGIVTHLLLVAALENPTVRRRYETTRDLLMHHNHLDLYERILDVTGYGHLSTATVEGHWRGMVDVFDEASSVPDAPYFFASDISLAARPISVEGTRDMLNRGFHREAMFWIVATWARAVLMLRHANGGSASPDHERGLESALASMGVRSAADLERRSQALLDLIPAVRNTSLEIMDSSPGICPGAALRIG